MDRQAAAYRHFFCASCGVQLRAKPSLAGKKLPCPKCGSFLLIPRSQQAEPSVAGPAGVEMYGVREAETRVRPMLPPLEHSGPVQAVSGKTVELYAVSAQRGEKSSAGNEGDDRKESGERGGKTRVKISTLPKPPPWPLVQGVLSFLFEPGAIIYWSVLSCLGTLCVSLFLLTVAVNNQIASLGTGVSSVLLLTVTILFSLVFVFINSVCGLTIIQESASGNREVQDWPGLAFIDYLFEMFYVVNSALLTGAAVWLVSRSLVGYEAPRVICGAIAAFILFPIVLLSMLESASCLLPVSAAVWQSLWRSRRTWLMFYAESFAMAIGFFVYLAVLGLVVERHAGEKTLPLFLFTVAMCVGPGVLLEMIYFRLMGRLAWVCDTDSRRELAEQEAAAEEQEDQKRRAAGEIRPTPVDDF